MAAISDYSSERFLLFFYLQIASILPTKFPVSWRFGSREELSQLPSCISNLNDFSLFFDLQAVPILPTRFLVNWLFGLEEEAQYRLLR